MPHDNSITVPFQITNNHILVMAPQLHLPHVNPVVLEGNLRRMATTSGSRQNQQGGFAPRMVHVQHPVFQPMQPGVAPRAICTPQAAQVLPAVNNQGGPHTQAVPVYQPAYVPPGPGGYGPIQHPPYPHNVVNGQPMLQGALAPLELGPIFRNSRAYTTSSSTLSLIPILTDSKDWTSWNNAVVVAIWTLGAMGHINDKEATLTSSPSSRTLPRLYTTGTLSVHVILATRRCGNKHSYCATWQGTCCLHSTHQQDN